MENQNPNPVEVQQNNDDDFDLEYEREIDKLYEEYKKSIDATSSSKSNNDKNDKLQFVDYPREPNKISNVLSNKFTLESKIHNTNPMYTYKYKIPKNPPKLNIIPERKNINFFSLNDIKYKK